MLKGMLNGHLILKKSRGLNAGEKRDVVGSYDKPRSFSTTLYNADGKPVVLKGMIRTSQQGGLTAIVTCMNLDIDLVD